MLVYRKICHGYETYGAPAPLVVSAISKQCMFVEEVKRRIGGSVYIAHVRDR
jgi:hypothetical protein